jgi:hypothetical protein
MNRHDIASIERRSRGAMLVVVIMRRAALLPPGDND